MRKYLNKIDLYDIVIVNINFSKSLFGIVKGIDLENGKFYITFIDKRYDGGWFKMGDCILKEKKEGFNYERDNI